jgi:hypothetical protein
MFELTLFDHLRMTFGHIVHRHRAHAEMAFARRRWDRLLRMAEVLLMTGVVGSALGAVFGRGYGFDIASAVLGFLALVALLIHLTLDLDRSAQVHAVCATLSDLTDGAIGVDAVRRKRDELMVELREVYEEAPPADQKAYQTAGQAIRTSDEGALADEEIDRFLPKSLQAAAKSARA